MIPHQYVTGKTAILLKNADYPQDDTRHKFIYNPRKIDDHTTEYDYATQPTQEQALKWLREEHGIILEPSYDTSNDTYFWCIYELGEGYHGTEGHNFSTWEDATEKGIRYACRYIIKSKKNDKS